MKKAKISDAELTKAAKAVRKTMLDSMPESIDHNFSASFELKMAEITREKEYCKNLCIAAKRSAAVFAAAAICIFSWLSIDTNSRNNTLEWIGKINEESIVYKHFASSNEILDFTV